MLNWQCCKGGKDVEMKRKRDRETLKDGRAKRKCRQRGKPPESPRSLSSESKGEGVCEEATRCQMGLFRDGLWIKSWAEKGTKKKSRIGFNVSFRAAKVPSWMSWQSLKKLELLIPSGTLPEVVWRECPSKSCSKSHGFPLSRRETPAGYMILYISSQPLRSGTSLSRRISSALTRQKPLSSLSYVLVLLYKIICLCESM